MRKLPARGGSVECPPNVPALKQASQYQKNVSDPNRKLPAADRACRRRIDAESTTCNLCGTPRTQGVSDQCRMRRHPSFLLARGRCRKCGSQVPVSYVVGEVELRKVCFRYPARPQVSIFENFSIRVSAGTILALVGQSGSGK